MTSNGGFKSFLGKVFEDSLSSSKFMKKIIDSVATIAAETKKIADLMLKMNERLNQHERVILTLLDLHNERERKEKEKNADYANVKSKEKQEKPN